MLGANEFIAQVLPLFLQFIGIPVVLGLAYYGYKNFYVPHKNQADGIQSETTEAVTDESNNNRLPPIESFVESEEENPIEDNLMSDQNQPTPDEQKPTTQSKKIDTSDLPPLDMLLGTLDEEPEPEPVPVVPDAPPEVVQLRKMEKGVQHVQLNSGPIAPAQEIISILRDEDDGKLIIQVGDTAYRTLADSVEVKRLFTQVMKELAGTITKPDSNPPARKRYVVGQPEETKSTSQSKATPKPQRKQAPVDDTVSSIRDLLNSESEEPEFEPTPPPAKPRPKATTPPPPTSDGTMPGDLPSYKLDDNPIKTEKKGRFGTKTEAEPVPELDLAAAIETYLQYKLQHTPDYAGRQIHIHGTPSGAIRIQVDDTYYDFVDEVADPDVRAFLQSTIAEWQDRQ